MKKGDIVLIPFPFTDLSGNKNRPTVVLIESDEDVTVCFITTQFKWMGEFDMILQPSDLNGLKTISLLRLNKFATIDKDLIIGRLGSLDQMQVKLLNTNLAKTFKIN
ncbi:MAG TPA: type II toxin-antitoxin system PemK/MazF family toxin [Prolixibacteraceae bacterium]